MPLPILTLSTSGSCPHGIPATFVATSSKVLIDAAPAMLDGDQAMVAGCPFTVPSGKPQPCVTAKLVMKATKVMAEGRPVILQGPADMCQSAEQIVQGPLAYTGVQTKVMAT